MYIVLLYFALNMGCRLYQNVHQYSAVYSEKRLFTVSNNVCSAVTLSNNSVQPSSREESNSSQMAPLNWMSHSTRSGLPAS